MIKKTWVYHITDVSNLPSILAAGGLLSFNRLHQQRVDYTSIAYENLQDRRATKKVPCGPGGVLHDYVPFHFAARSPMLCAISKGNVPACPNGQDTVIYLVSTAEEIKAAGLGLAFSDGHGIMRLTRFFDDLSCLDQVDWELMKSKMWNETANDLDRPRRRQAEFLVHQFMPWSLVAYIGAKSRVVTDTVQKYIKDSRQPVPRIDLRTEWYY